MSGIFKSLLKVGVRGETTMIIICVIIAAIIIAVLLYRNSQNH